MHFILRQILNILTVAPLEFSLQAVVGVLLKAVKEHRPIEQSLQALVVIVNRRIADIRSNHTSLRFRIALPSLQVMAGYNLPKYRLGFFLSAYFNYAYNNLEGGPSLLQEKESILHLLPEVRVYYSWEPKMRMYAALGYGVRFRHYDEIFNGTTEGYNSINGTFTLVPFGISIGEKAAFSVDVGLGRTCAPLAMRFAYLF